MIPTANFSRRTVFPINKREQEFVIAVQPVQILKNSDGSLVVKVRVVSTTYRKGYKICLSADLCGRGLFSSLRIFK